MARMAEVEELARPRRQPRVGSGAALVCVVLALLEVWLGPMVTEVGTFYPSILALEPWRFVAANFLHAGFPHLALNVLVLLLFGPLVERPIGAARTILILAASGAGAMTGSLLAGHQMVLGASGLAMGLVGAALWLELRAPERLPATWRIPRRSFLALVLLQLVVDQIVPAIAAAAHVGGLAAGWCATAVLVRGAESFGPSTRRLRAAAGVAALAPLLCLYASAHPWLVGGKALVERAERLAAAPDVHPGLLNAYAWTIVTREDPTPAQVDVALVLAERAVSETDRTNPDVLDTLAEAQFVSGDTREALATIEEAIALAPREPYFREQRRRYLGERDPGDRPDPPTYEEGPPLPAPTEPFPDERLEEEGDEPGVRV
jgi:membrane associated rhomboid family serine protease